jgi:hypothetical protein
MNNHGPVVQAVLSNQFVSPNVRAADEETAKSQLTRAAAYELNKLDPNIGLIEKTSGNQVYNMSVDGVHDRTNGDYADICTAQGVGNPVVTIATHWIQRNGPGQPITTGWIQPTQAIAALPGPMQRTGSAPPPDPTEPPILGGGGSNESNDEIMNALNGLQLQMDDLAKRQASDTAVIIERDDFNTQKIQENLDRIVNDMEESLKKVMLILLANRDGSILPEHESQAKSAFKPKGEWS